ncbi:MAG: hypothetical protein AAGL90_12405 [Pseudomonadota bacterium]
MSLNSLTDNLNLDFIADDVFEEITQNTLSEAFERDDLSTNVASLLDSLKQVSTPSEKNYKALAALKNEGLSAVNAPDGDLILQTSQDALIAIRRAPILSSQLAQGMPAWTRGLEEAAVIGPVWDGLGREIWLHIFRRVRQVRFVRAQGGTPFLSVPHAQFINTIQNAASTKHKLAKGSLWVAAHLFDDTAVDRFCGVKIAAGNLTFSESISVIGDEVIIPTNVSCSIEIELDPPDAAPTDLTPDDPGADVRASAFVPPKKLKIEITRAGSSISAVSDASINLFGQSIDFAAASAPARYYPGFNRLLIPMAVQADTLDVGQAIGTDLDLDGTAPIIGGGLALSTAVIDPSQMGNASGVGAMMLELDAGLTARLESEPSSDDLGPSILMLDHERIALTAESAEHLGSITSRRFGSESNHGRADIDRSSRGELRYFAQADGQETVVFSAKVDIRPDLPRDVAGDRVPLLLPTALVILSRNTSGRFLAIFGTVFHQERRKCFSIKNALCRANEPVFAMLLGELDQTDLKSARLWSFFPLDTIVPTLPDPYASNTPLFTTRKHRGSSWLVSRLSFNDAERELEMLLLNQPELPRLISPKDSPSTRIGADTGSAKIADSVDDTSWRKALGTSLTFETVPKLMLLDVSSAAGQLGVALRPNAAARREIASSAESATAPDQPIAISNLSLEVDSDYAVLVMLPAVQWEPVVALPPDPGDAIAFPDQVVFLNSGVPSVIEIPDDGNVAIAPGPIYDKILNSPENAGRSRATARFTLPFGMLAQARLSSPTASQRGTIISESRPTAQDLEGAPQLNLSAEDRTLAADQTPAMPGHVVQLPIALPANGIGPMRSVLGDSVTTIFNTNLGASSADALVPLTRIGLSGYGESVFSRWINPKNALTQVDKVTFDVPVGRIAREIVQVRSILLPYGVPVVRTVTLKRKADAIVGRSDSGWVAAGDGAYDLPGSGVVTHPGVVRSITNVENIQETGQRVTADGQVFVAVYFQGDLRLDGRSETAPVKRHLGYVRLSASGPSFTPTTYQDLIEQVGPMGGGVDAMIKIANGNHKMRLQRIGVGASGSEFAMAAWGSLVFPGGGEWSILAANDPAGEPNPVDQETGLPIIREGAAGAATSHPYRFAAPEDLLTAMPGTDFGILHSMGMQRAFYRRPVIEPLNPNRIVSDQRPVIADVFGLARATSVFPAQIDCIPFPNADFALEARTDGSFHLDGPGQFPSGIGRRTVSTAGTVVDAQDYSNSEVTYELDTRDLVPWRFSITQVQQISANSAMGDLVTSTLDIISDGEPDSRFENTRVALGGPLEIVQDFLTLLEDLGLPNNLDARMENGFKLYVGGRFPLLNFDPATGLVSGDALQIPMVSPTPIIIFSDTYLEVFAVYDGELKNKKTKVIFSGAPMFAIQSVPGLYVVAIIKLGISLFKDDGTIVELTFGFGFAWVWKVSKALKIKGMFAVAFHLVFGDNLYGWGAGFILKANLSYFPIVSVTLRIEGLGVRLTHRKDLPDETVYTINKLQVSLDITVGFLFSFSVDLETRSVGVTRGPLPIEECPEVL